MKPLEQFEINVASADNYLLMYRELRKFKEIGSRGRLDEENKYLMWLPRATIIASIAALDAYVHQVLYVRIPQELAGEQIELSNELAELVGRVMPTKKNSEIRVAMSFVRSRDGAKLLSDNIREKILAYASYQDPKKILKAFRIIRINDIFGEVAQRWSDKNRSRDDITKELLNYSKRRNQIAHESDLDNKHEPRAITPDYGKKCLGFVREIVECMDRVAFPAQYQAQQ